ncbi:MFS transporter [Thermococcus waiotapuensis]|uniref:MFS transporter n=1 Tax=Thermococcus waiotapuensis TaxID=90909 RepID=A0AAE4NUR8_9EURY|nr:MFS transporter [Thermococcus waiotapuensis]MDV3103691.1 MFS transporter [Thermococcus waiotapuensis]
MIIELANRINAGENMGLNRNFWLFEVGRFVSQLGWAVQDVALPLYVLDQTKSGSIMSLFIIAEILPRALLSPIAGVIGDRYNRKNLMVWLDIARGVLLFAVIAFDLLSIGELLVVQVATSIMGTFFGAATEAMYPDLVKEEELTIANSLLQSFDVIARIVGPALGGIIYAFGGVKLAILINAVSFFGSGLFEVLIHYEWTSRKIESPGEVIGDIKEGIAFLRSSKYLAVILSYALFINFLFNPVFAVALPYVYRVELAFSSQWFGFLQTAFMAGMLLGNVAIMARLGSRAESMLFRALFVQLGTVLMLAILISPLLSMSAFTLFVIFMGLNAVDGFFNALVNVPIVTKLQRAIPSELRGRIFSVFDLTMGMTIPLSMALVGSALDYVPTWALFAVSGFLGLLLPPTTTSATAASLRGT